MITIHPSLKSLFESGVLWFGTKPSSVLFSDKRRTTGSLFQFSIEEIDSLLPHKGLSWGSIHEWALKDDLFAKTTNEWQPPILLATLLMRNAILSHLAPGERKFIAWVGRKCWPTPHMLEKIFPREKIPDSETAKPGSESKEPFTGFAWRDACLFFNAQDKEKRLLTILELFRCPAVVAVFADGSGFQLIAARRLQLAARRENALGILFRPPWEISNRSTAQTKWKLSPLPVSSSSWSVELLCAKGLAAPLCWHVKIIEEEDNEQISLCLISPKDDHDRAARERKRRVSSG